MPLALLPVVDLMLEYYELPGGFERFKEYIRLLTGGTGDDMKLPIGGFNPMGKAHVKEKLLELKNLKAEAIMSGIISEFNSKDQLFGSETFHVSVSLADDLKGGWTNRYTTDYQAKFNSGSIIKRKFQPVGFWTSDSVSKELIELRTKETLYRLQYQLKFPKPETLEDHVKQEAFVNTALGQESDTSITDYSEIKDFYTVHKTTIEYPVIFNFLYGDQAAEELGYKPIGIKIPFAGFEFAGALAK